jgi:hypothetical protein
MQRELSVLTLCLGTVMVGSVALAQNTNPVATEGTMSTQSTPTTQSSTSTASATQGAFDKLSRREQRIASALCDAQTDGCPPTQSSAPSTSSSTRTTSSSTTPPTLTRDQIAAMKQHMGWWRIFKQMQANGQIPSRVKNP